MVQPQQSFKPMLHKLPPSSKPWAKETRHKDHAMATGVPHRSHLAGSTALLPGKLWWERQQHTTGHLGLTKHLFLPRERHPDLGGSCIRVTDTIFNIKHVCNHLLLIIYTTKVCLVLLLNSDVRCFIGNVTHHKDLTMLYYFTYSRWMAYQTKLARYMDVLLYCE